MQQANEMKARTAPSGLYNKGLIPDWLDRIFLKSVTPIIALFSAGRVNPNIITTSGFLLNLGAAYLIVSENLTIAGVMVAVAGICDFVDGKVAARTQRITTFGAIYDSVLDRYSDMALYMALGIYFLQHDFSVCALGAALAMIGSVMTSYTKAIGEARGFRFRAGCLRRQERMTILCIALIFSSADAPAASWLSSHIESLAETISSLPNIPVTIAVYSLALFSNITALQRLFVLRRLAQNETGV